MSAECSDRASPLVRRMAALAPRCFEACPRICAAVDALSVAYLADFDKQALKARTCAERTTFSCFWAAEHSGSCAPVVAATRTLGAPLPATYADFEASCGPTAANATGPASAEVAAALGTATATASATATATATAPEQGESAPQDQPARTGGAAAATGGVASAGGEGGVPPADAEKELEKPSMTFLHASVASRGREDGSSGERFMAFLAALLVGCR